MASSAQSIQIEISSSQQITQRIYPDRPDHVIQQPDVQLDESISYKKQLFLSMVKGLCVQLLLVNVAIILIWQVDWIFFLAFVVLVHLLELVEFVSNKGIQKHKLLFVDLLLALCSTITIMCYNKSLNIFPLHYITSTTILSSFLTLLYYGLEKSSPVNPFKIHRMGYQIFKLCINIQVLLFSLWWEIYPEWTCEQVVIVFDIILTFFALMLTLSFIALIEVVLQKNEGQRKTLYVKGTLWIFFFLVGLTFSPYFMIVTSCQSQSQNQNRLLDRSQTFAFLIATIFYTIAFGTYSYYQSTPIIRQFINFVNNMNDEGGELFDDENQQDPNLQNPNISIQASVQNVPRIVRRSNTVGKAIQLPLKLIQMSSTFYSTCKDKGQEIKTQKQQGEKQDEENKHLTELQPQDPEDPPDLFQAQDISIQESTCLICLAGVPDIVFQPCYHGGVCEKCAILLLERKQKCILCRQDIQFLLKVTKNIIDNTYIPKRVEVSVNMDHYVIN